MTTAETALAEYQALKAEQLARIGTRDGLIYATFASIGGAVLGATRLTPALLLALPIAVGVLGWTYLANDIKISEIGEYVRDHLATGSEAFGWERHHRTSRDRRLRKHAQLVVDEGAFVVPGLAALVTLWAQAVPAWVTLASVIELPGVLTLAFLIHRANR